MAEREKEMLICFRQLPPKDQVAVLSQVRTAYVAENAAKKTPARVSAEDSGDGGKGHGDMTIE